MREVEHSSRTSVRKIAPITVMLFITNLIIYGWMLSKGEFVVAWQADYLLTWGANYAPLTMNGQWWRLLTCLFVHGGVLHLGFNLWILWQVGPFVERLVGSVGLLIVYLASGLCSSLAGLYCSPLGVIEGASGALFGLVGGLIAFLLINRKKLPVDVMRKLRNSCLIFLGLNVVLGLAVEKIDTAGHTTVQTHLKPELSSYIQIRQKSWELLVESIRENNNRKLAQHYQTWSTADQLARRLSVAN